MNIKLDPICAIELFLEETAGSERVKWVVMTHASVCVLLFFKSLPKSLTAVNRSVFKIQSHLSL